MDKNVTAYSGLDALSHAVESYFSKGANDLTRIYSEMAINLIFKYLPAAYKDGKNKEARYYMLFASFVAGLSFANAGLGAVHGIGHTIGAVCKMPHGLTNAILLPYVLTFNAKFCPEKLKNLEEKTFKNFIKETFLLNKKLNVPQKYSDVCPDIKSRMNVILSNISFSGSMSFNPVKMTIKEVEKILKDVI
jgi:alcohol dehydrogenase class IV